MKFVYTDKTKKDLELDVGDMVGRIERYRPKNIWYVMIYEKKGGKEYPIFRCSVLCTSLINAKKVILNNEFIRQRIERLEREKKRTYQKERYYCNRYTELEVERSLERRDVY